MEERHRERGIGAVGEREIGAVGDGAAVDDGGSPAGGTWGEHARASLRLGGLLAAPVIRWAAGRRGADSFAVITYHRVGGAGDPFFPGVSVERFRRQMHHFARHWNLLPVSELLRRAEERSLPRRALGVTFDDSYRSVYDLAWPVLQEVGATAMVFVPTGPLRDGRPLWYDRVLHAMKTTSATRLPALGAPALDGAPLGSAPERARRGRDLLAWMRGLDEGDRRARLAQLEESLAPAPWDREPALAMANVERLRRVAARGLELGSHSVTHPIFAVLGRQRIREELQQSRRDLEEWLQRPVEMFAYPNGRSDDFDAVTREELRRAGYRYAFTTEFGINTPEDLGTPYRLHRNDAAGTSAAHLDLRLARLSLSA